MSQTNPRIPAPTKKFKHSTSIQLRFNDIDMFGHVNNAMYFQFFDLGKLRYFEDVLGKDFAEKGFYALIVNVNCDFFAPALLSENLEVLSAVVHIGEKSLTLEQRIVNSDNGDVKSVCRTVMAGINPETMKSTAIPESFVKDIKYFED